MLRVNALYGNSRQVVFFLTTIFVAQFTVFLCLSIISGISYSRSAISVPIHFIGCTYGSPNLPLIEKLESMFYGFSFASHAILFSLTIARAGKNFMFEQGGLRRLFRNENFSPILTSIVRDGTIYFCLLFVATALLLFTSFHDAAYDSSLRILTIVTHPGYLAMLSFTGSHLVLNLKKLTSDLIENDTTTATQSIFFARPPGRNTEGEETNEITVIYMDSCIVP
ncbi:hypothetical protein BDQ17DRAFT_1363789 [Cyathus striatus]|nr:hypothetical protein BDQ17DRAFT_1363789 [Cyathus striatus]